MKILPDWWPKISIRITDSGKFMLWSFLFCAAIIAGMLLWPQYKVYTLVKQAEGEVRYLGIRGLCQPIQKK